MSGQVNAGDEGGLLAAFRALANADRLAVLRVLRECAPSGMNISQVAAATELTRFTASRHLQVLCVAGFVSATRHEKSIMHRLDPHGFEQVEDWLYDSAPTAAGRATDAWRESNMSGLS